MNGFNLPTREGWCVEGYIYINKKCISKYYLKSEIKTKEEAKKQFLIDNATIEEKDFDKIDVLECCL
jgi:hypothetical protein